MSIDAKKRELLLASLKKIEKDHGKGAAMFGADRPNEGLAVYPTGSISLDAALGVGGWPKGRIIEVYGPESSGKTTLALHAIATTQANGGICAFIDAEHAIDPEYAKHLGVNFDDLVISQPDTGEQALNILEDLASSGVVDLIVVDSVAALVPRAEIEGEMGDTHVGLQARLMSQALRKITGLLSNNNTTAIFINQLREKIGMMGYGPNETTTGGKALKFYATVRVDIRRTGSVKSGEDVIGNTTKIKVVKNKVAPPFKIINVDIIYGEGIERASELINLGTQFKVLSKSGNYYQYGDIQLGNGLAKSRAFLNSPEGYDVANAIESEIRAVLFGMPVADAPYDDDPDAAASAA